MQAQKKGPAVAGRDRLRFACRSHEVSLRRLSACCFRSRSSPDLWEQLSTSSPHLSGQHRPMGHPLLGHKSPLELPAIQGECRVQKDSGISDPSAVCPRSQHLVGGRGGCIRLAAFGGLVCAVGAPPSPDRPRQESAATAVRRRFTDHSPPPFHYTTAETNRHSRGQKDSGQNRCCRYANCGLWSRCGIGQGLSRVSPKERSHGTI
jgi:hypothetical protein